MTASIAASMPRVAAVQVHPRRIASTGAVPIAPLVSMTEGRQNDDPPPLRGQALAEPHLYSTEWRQLELAGGVICDVLVISDDEAVEAISMRLKQCHGIAPAAGHPHRRVRR